MPHYKQPTIWWHLLRKHFASPVALIWNFEPVDSGTEKKKKIKQAQKKEIRNVENVLLILICAITLLLIQGCLNNRFYQPNQTLYNTPDQYNLHYEEVFFKSKDDTKLHG